MDQQPDTIYNALDNFIFIGKSKKIINIAAIATAEYGLNQYEDNRRTLNIAYINGTSRSYYDDEAESIFHQIVYFMDPRNKI